MTSTLTTVVARVATAALTLGLLTIPMAPAHAATATVPNGITTKDLTAIGITPAALAAELAGAGVSVTNVHFTGANAQAGTIDVLDPSVVSFNHGVILSSGNIADVVGPNKSDGTTGDMAGAGDADLTALIANTQTVNPATYDAASLEFDFTPTASTVYFTYTFSSDEYLEWVNLFNDVFAFYVNGTNCATVPGGVVSINTINSNVNPNLFRDNSFSSPPTNPINIESDGLSVEMICTAAVNPGVTNHMKLAIADTSDQILDSVVMIKAGSLSTTKPESCNDGVDNNDDTLVDMADTTCQTTTQAPPTGSTGSGSGGMAPAFTGNEGTPIVLDASALGWTPSSDTVTTSWAVTGINGTSGTCDVSPAGPQALIGGLAAVVYANCPTDGEYVARIDGWDVENKGSWDTDVDFFVHNAPPTVSLDSPTPGSTVDVGAQVDLSATVSDLGGDTVTCSISWGDDSTEAGSIADGLCTGSHAYAATGDRLISVTATDGTDSAATATVITVTSNLPTQAITVTTAPPATAGYGTSFTVASTGGASGQPLAFGSSGGCSNLGDTFTMTSGVTACDVTIDQAGDANYAAAPQESFTVGAVQRDISIQADPQTKSVGSADPALTYAITSGSLLGADSLTGALDRAPGETVGSYPISQGTLAATDDYALAFTGANFTITQLPSITSITPTSGGVGTSVTVTGKNLQGATAVAFKGTAAPFTILSDTSIVTSAPTGAKTGTITVTTPNGTATSASFTVSTTKRVPTVTGFTPTSGKAGTVITVTGTNLAGATSIKVGTATVSSGWTVLSATQLSVPVPASAATGTVAVTTAGGTGTSAASLTVLVTPTITSFTPASGLIGSTVTVTGTGFLTGATSVTFNGTAAATVTVASGTSLKAVVPAGATSGSIAVTTAGGSATSATSFTVAAGVTLSVSKTGSGTITSSSGGINCGTTCSATVAAGTPVTLTATAATGSVFTGWAGACTGTATTCTLPMASSTSAAAAFLTKPTLSYTGTTRTTRGATITLSAKVTAGTKAIPGIPVTFTMAGATYAATTNAAGTASISAKAPATAATYPLTVATAGSGSYGPATATASLRVR